ncbi:MFS transporter [Vulcaniibacterium tengchongense]|uniref:MFS transporter n=1 Tax=Vulcaniibacterium tengchongense TaxID=1273429 RepID=A0A3N4VRS3_9GAMM|nr:MFS transporter [Vulcaniibacterium tengchongense]
MSRYAPREWQPHERPMLPGSPSTPLHPTPRRIGYFVVGLLVAITGGLGNALVTANLANLQGAIGATSAEIAWLPAAYVMTNASVNLVLVKFRQQFGLRLFTEFFLGLYALVTFAHLFVNDLGSAIAVRAAHGVAGAALSTLGLYYTMQAFPAAHRLRGLVVGIGVAQLAQPLARIFSAELLEFGEWRGLYLFELGLALVALGGVLMLKLPPSDRVKAFEKEDFLTFALFAPGIALLCAVLSLGRIDWWLEAAWIGWALCGAIVLLTSAFALEHFRANPLINTRWLASGTMVRLAVSLLLIRIALSEQSTGAVGFLQALGLTNDQMHGLFAMVLAGCLAGIVASALTIRPNRMIVPAAIALACIAAGALLDSRSSHLTRPEQMYLSQFLIGFGSTFFLGPAMVSGIGQVIAQPRNLISFVVLFGMAQNVGGLVGAAALGTFQTVREKFHSSQLVEHLTLLDPQVAARVQAGASAYAPTVADPALRNAQGVRALGAVATREANVLAYNDVFLAIAALSLLTMAWMLFHRLRLARRDRLAALARTPAR